MTETSARTSSRSGSDVSGASPRSHAERQRSVLSSRMSRVLKELERVRSSPDADAVHNLRVALRRCRSIAAIMKEVDPDPTWRTLRRRPRKLFRALGALRDLQVLEEWIETLTLPDNALRRALLETLQGREAEPRARLLEAIEAFDQKAWKRLARVLDRRVRLVTSNGAVAQCLALERHMELRRAHSRAVRTRTPERWHQLRLALKHFRYVVESFLPVRHANLQKGLKQTQDLLGKLNDLHMLETFVGHESAETGAEAVESLRQAICAERQACMTQYGLRTGGHAGVLSEWRAGLPRGARIDAATAARIRSTARALDPRFRCTVQAARLALQLFDILATSAADFRDVRIRTILRTAARLHGIRGANDRRSRQKGACRVLRRLPVPVGWRRHEWEVLALTVRYHRGAEPKPTHAAFARLPAERQELVRGLAGVLRLARALRRSGATAVIRAGGDETAGDLRLRAPGIVDNRRSAARLAAAKHLLEIYFSRRVIIERG